MQFRTGTSSYEMVLSGRNNGQIQSGNSSDCWAVTWLQVRLVSGYGCPRTRAPQLDTGAAMWLAGGLENSTYEESPKAMPLLCLRKERRAFQHVGLQRGRQLFCSLPVGQQGGFGLVTGK